LYVAWTQLHVVQGRCFRSLLWQELLRICEARSPTGAVGAVTRTQRASEYVDLSCHIEDGDAFNDSRLPIHSSVSSFQSRGSVRTRSWTNNRMRKVGSQFERASCWLVRRSGSAMRFF